MPNLLIEAGPGTGKTYTIENARYHILGGYIPASLASPEQQAIYDWLKENVSLGLRAKICYFSHTNSIKDKLEKSLPKTIPVYTFHAAGMSQLTKLHGYCRLDKYRTDKFIEKLTGESISHMSKADKQHWLDIKKLVKHFKIEGIEVNNQNFNYIYEKYSDVTGIEFPDDWATPVKTLMRMALHPNKTVDYDDMIWMPSKLIRRPTFDVGFVDESQDLGGTTYKLVKAMCKNLVFVGDRNQAINAFAGADEDMFNKIEKEVDMKLPLKTTFRLPLNIVEKANNFIPNSVLPGTNRIVGEDRSLRYDEYFDKLKTLPPEETLTICRTNQPIFITCLKMIRKNLVPELVRSKNSNNDLATRILSFVKNTKSKSLAQLDKVLDWMIDKATKSNNPMAELQTTEMVECIRFFMEEVNDLDELENLIKSLLSSSTRKNAEPRYRLSTIHNAKGLESENIFILNPPIPHPLAMKHPVARKQEKNLEFVAITRTKRNLYWVR